MVEFGLIGRNISHSFSADFFNKKFRHENIDARYSLFDLPKIGFLPDLLASTPGIKGLNVTSPFKREVIPFLDALSEDAATLNAVNVIRVEKNGSLKGFNTDWYGFLMSLQPYLSPLTIRNAVILGTGGAASAVEFALNKAGITFLNVSRTPTGNQISYSQLKDHLPLSQLIVNATPVGMFPHTEECPLIDFDLMGPKHLCYDLIYNPEETLFLKNASKRGAVCKNGLEMLHLQAQLAWNIWNKKVDAG